MTMSGMGGAVASAAASEHYSVNNDTGHNVTIEPDFNDKGQGAGGIGSIAASFKTGTIGVTSSVVGAYSYVGYLDGLGKPVTTNDSHIFQGATTAVYGAFNVVKTAQDVSKANAADGVANSVVGQANLTENANAAIIMGAGNKITNSYRDLNNIDQGKFINPDILKFQEGLSGAVKESGGQVMAIGGGNEADYAQRSQLMGVGNTLKGTEDNISTLNYLEGFYNNAENVENAYIIGADNTVKNGKHNIIFGDNHTIDSKDNNIVIGSADDAQSIDKAGVVQIGHNAKVEKDGGVAIGEGSIASVDKGVKGYDPTTGTETTETGEAWVSKAAAVSVGDKDKKITRQITNVAAGKEATDAVNVAQLKKAADGAKTHYYSVSKALPFGNLNYNYDNDGAVAPGSLAAGQNAIATGYASTVTGSYSIIGDLQNPKTQNGFKGATAVTYGTFNAVLTDSNSPMDGVANSVVGQANMTQNANAAIIMGAGNTVTNSYRGVVFPDIEYGTPQEMYNTLKKAVPESGGQVMAMGGGNTVDGAYQSQVMGVGNTLKGAQGDYDEGTSTRLNYIEGFYNTVDGTAKTAQNDYIIGANNTVTSGKNNIIFGNKRKVTEKDDNIIIGSGEGDDGLATTVSKAIILGNKANATVEGGIAIGEGSIASVDKGAVGYDPSGKATKTGGAWVATNAAVAIGNGDTLTRQITGVAAGTNDTDAVNVAQLKQVQDAIDAKVDTNTTYTLNGTTETEESGATKTTITLKDDKDQAAGSVTVRNDTLAKDQNNALSLNGNTLSLSIKDTAGNEAKGKVDLSAFKSAVDTDTRNTVAAGDHISLKEDAQADGSTKYTVSVKTDGKVASGDTGIVTGDTVYKETRTASDGFVTKTTATAGENILALDKQVKTNSDQIAVNTTNIANMDQRVTNNTEAINNINQNVDNMGRKINNLDSKINKVGAGAAALAALHPQDFDPDDKWDFAAGFGNYRDANAMAIGAFYRPDNKTMFSVGGSMGNGENMVNVGVSLKFGKSSPYAGMSKAALVNTIEDMKAKDAKRDEVISQQQKEIEDLKAAVAKLMAK